MRFSWPRFRKKNRQGPALKAVPLSGAAAAGDGGARPIDPRMAGPPRQVGWAMAARILGIAAFASGLANVSLAVLVYDFSTRVRIQPMLLTLSPRSDQVVRVEPFHVGTRGFSALTEALISDYVRQRHTILRDQFEMKRRWGGHGHIWRYSAGEEYSRFTKELRAGAGKLLDLGISRFVYLTSNPVRVDRGFYRVDFATIDCGPDEVERDRAAWTASVTVGYAPDQVRVDERYMNPIGLQVTGYAVQRKHGSDAAGVGGCFSDASGIIEALAKTGVKSTDGATTSGLTPAAADRAARPVAPGGTKPGPGRPERTGAVSRADRIERR